MLSAHAARAGAITPTFARSPQGRKQHASASWAALGIQASSHGHSTGCAAACAATGSASWPASAPPPGGSDAAELAAPVAAQADLAGSSNELVNPATPPEGTAAGEQQAPVGAGWLARLVGSWRARRASQRGALAKLGLAAVLAYGAFSLLSLR